MQRILQTTAILLLSLGLVFGLASCSSPETDLWAGATYSQDTELGTGAKTLVVEVTAQERTVTLTLKTDRATVGEALMEHGLIAGEEGAYGLYVKTVNGMTADYDVDHSYWAFYRNGETMLTAVDQTEIQEGGVYQLVRDKG